MLSVFMLNVVVQSVVILSVVMLNVAALQKMLSHPRNNFSSNLSRDGANVIKLFSFVFNAPGPSKLECLFLESNFQHSFAYTAEAGVLL